MNHFRKWVVRNPCQWPFVTRHLSPRLSPLPLYRFCRYFLSLSFSGSVFSFILRRSLFFLFVSFLSHFFLFLTFFALLTSSHDSILCSFVFDKGGRDKETFANEIVYTDVWIDFGVMSFFVSCYLISRFFVKRKNKIV